MIIAKRGTPVQLTMTNKLPSSHFLPVDPTTSMGESNAGRHDRIAVHLHGGLVDWTSDGGPYSWYSNPANGGFVYGSSFMNGASAGSAVYNYPNQQSARLVWYHDHAFGNTRLNAYAGLASGYIITDDAESQLITSGVLPNVPGYSLGIPLIMQDKIFNENGSLWYPDIYDPSRWSLQSGKDTPPRPSVVPESFGDTILVNGAPYPYLNVAPGRYRFRILNGSQARFYNLQTWIANEQGTPRAVGPAFVQVGTEGGFLPAPVAFAPLDASGNPLSNTNSNRPAANGDPNQYNLLLAPAERADVIVDFRGYENQTIVLYNDAPAPFPTGDPVNDFSADGTTGPNTRTLMMFKVSSGPVSKELTFQATWTALKTALPAAYAASQPKSLTTAGLTANTKTLNEDYDEYGRLRQLLGAGPGPGQPMGATPTEVAKVGETQVWTIYNRTGDTHPIHFHLVNVQLLGRAAFTELTPGDLKVVGTPRPPDPNERGWKETIRMNPGEATTVIMRFDLPTGPPGQTKKVPLSPRLLNKYGMSGYEYVWHCHILEHEEHDMMRPLVIKL